MKYDENGEVDIETLDLRLTKFGSDCRKESRIVGDLQSTIHQAGDDEHLHELVSS